MLKHMLSFHVEYESKMILVEQVVEESLVVMGFYNCGTDPEPEIVNEGKPRMHTTLPCILQIDFAFASFYCIKLLGVK